MRKHIFLGWSVTVAPKVICEPEFPSHIPFGKLEAFPWFGSAIGMIISFAVVYYFLLLLVLIYYYI